MFKKAETFKKSIIPLTIICGPPGAGKSTLINNKNRDETLVIDFAEIKSRVSGLGLYEAGDKWLVPALKERAKMLGILAAPTQYKDAVFITLAPEKCVRSDWENMLGAEKIIVMETDPYTCIERIAKSSVRNVRTPLFWRTLIFDWWDTYVRSDSDEIIK